MERKEELKNLFINSDETIVKIISPLIDDIIFIETQLERLKKLPFIQVKQNDVYKQRPTPAAKQYKELLQQYNNCIKLLWSVIGENENQDDISPLREYFKNKKKISLESYIE